MTPAQLRDTAVSLGAKPFVAKQMADWLYKKQVRSTDGMANLPKQLREKLRARYEVGCTPPADCQRSADGTVKYLYRTSGGHYVETVYIPDGHRATLCVSSQVGCKMGCAFCMTGRQGYAASLPVADILNQIYSLPERDTLTNIVFMGQGEPFDNLSNVLAALDVLTADWGYGWSPKRITVSSVGLAKGLTDFLRRSRCHLAISMHNPFPAERARLMPAERALSITQVADILRGSGLFPKDGRTPDGESHQRRLSFEYIVFGGLNDTPRHAKGIISLLHGLDCRVNLIRFHDIPDTPLHGADEETMVRFRDMLTAGGVFTTIRASRGQDIFAACGLLSTAKQEAEANGEDNQRT